jgi:hypothetical protein
MAENTISSSNVISNILKNDTEFLKYEVTNLLNDNFNGFINRIKLTTEQIIEDKIVKFYNGTFDVNEIIFTEDGTNYINYAKKWLQSISSPSNQEWVRKQEKLLELDSNKCFSIYSCKEIQTNNNNNRMLVVFYLDKIISFIYTRELGGYLIKIDEKYIKSVCIIKNILPINSIYVIRTLINNFNGDVSGTPSNNGNAHHFPFNLNIANLSKEMEENPQYFVNNCMEFENLCNEEKQNYMNKMNILENERKEIEIIKQECNEKMEIYHKLQSEYDEFQMEKQKIAEEKKKLQLVKLKLEEMRRKLDEERAEFEKQKELLNGSEIDLDELLH